MEKNYKERLEHYFKLIAIRTITPTTAECNIAIRTTIVQAIQKSMTGDNDWHFFCHGSKVSENEKAVFIPKDSLYDYHLFNGGKTKVSIGAIVGKNGSGKSTVWAHPDFSVAALHRPCMIA